MLLKVLGSAAVLISCTGIGFWLGNTKLLRIQQLKELRAEFLLLRGDIRYRQSSLPEAFNYAASRKNQTFEPLFRRLSEALTEYVWESFEQAYQNVAGEALAETELKVQDKQLLEQFAGMLGQMDIGMQLSALDWYLEQSGQVLKDISTGVERKVGLCKSLGVLSGIFLLIILL